MACSLCKDFGLVHPVRPDSKVDWGNLVYCRCRGEKAGQPASRPHIEEAGGRYSPAAPEAIDFSVSWDFYRHYSQYFGWPDPGPDMPVSSTRMEDLEDRIGNLEAISAEPGRVPRYFHDKIQQLEGRVLHGEAKWQEHLGKSSKKPSGKKLKGIET
jgi:hypothetical protein